MGLDNDGCCVSRLPIFFLATNRSAASIGRATLISKLTKLLLNKVIFRRRSIGKCIFIRIESLLNSAVGVFPAAVGINQMDEVKGPGGSCTGIYTFGI